MFDDTPGAAAQGDALPADRPDDIAERKRELELRGQRGRPESAAVRTTRPPGGTLAGRRVGGDSRLRAVWHAGRLSIAGDVTHVGGRSHLPGDWQIVSGIDLNALFSRPVHRSGGITGSSHPAG